MNMREKLARAIWDNWAKHVFGAGRRFDDLKDENRERALDAADVVLAALEYPTEGMLNSQSAIMVADSNDRRVDFAALGLIAWQDMIRAAKDGK